MNDEGDLLQLLRTSKRIINHDDPWWTSKSTVEAYLQPLCHRRPPALRGGRSAAHSKAAWKWQGTKRAMTWNDLQQLISKMIPAEREQAVVYIDDYSGPDRRVVEVEVVKAFEDVYCGISVANECVLKTGQQFLSDPKDNLDQRG